MVEAYFFPRKLQTSRRALQPGPKRRLLGAGFGLRRQAKRDTALELRKHFGHITPGESAVAAALCRRTPRRFAFIHDQVREDRSLKIGLSVKQICCDSGW